MVLEPSVHLLPFTLNHCRKNSPIMGKEMSEKLKKGLWAKNALIFRILSSRRFCIMNMLFSV